MNPMNYAKRVFMNMLFPTVPFCEKKPFKDYYVEIDNKQFAVYKPKKEKIVAANGDVVCTQLLHNKKLCIFTQIFKSQIVDIRYLLIKTLFPV